MNDLVSVIIPTYEGATLLPRAINGILAQTYINFEIIIVDDNGLDTPNQKETSKIISSYLNDRRIKYLVHDINKNGSAARNTGVKNSHGKYIAFLDDDDVYYPNFIENQVKLLSSLVSDYAMVYCSHESYLNNSKFEEYHAKQSGNLLYENLIHKVEIATSSILIKRDVFVELNGFDETFRRHQDWEFVVRVASKYKIMANDFIGYKRYLELRNVPQNADKAKQFRLYFVDKMKPIIGLLHPNQQRQVLLSNRMDVSLWYIKEHKYKDFLKEYHEISPGFFGIYYIIKRLILIIKRKKIRIL